MAQSLKFPSGFMWGTATASFQIEGASKTERTPSIWDAFCEVSGNVRNGDTGEVTCDHYNRFREDVQLIKSLGTKHYRFSIAWPRIQKWDDSGQPLLNLPGVRFYNQLIDELIQNGITPVATLYHWDLPIPIQKQTGGWSGTKQIGDLFSDYARICFAHFGDRVKYWITLNEPWCSALLGYETGEHAPGKSPTVGIVPKPGIDVYRAGHNLLLAHAKAVKVYRSEFKPSQNGVIGITLNSNWSEPKDPKDPECIESSQRDIDFELGWFADPVYFGDYPKSMRETVKGVLPTFSDEEQTMLRNSSDFFGLNHYSTSYSLGMMKAEDRKEASFFNHKGTRTSGNEFTEKSDMGWAIVPWGFKKLILYIQKTYSPVGGIIVTENGLAARETSVEEMKADNTRVEFYRRYISAMHDAMNANENAADVRGYFLWSLLDNFEWSHGYSKRFGLYYVDYKTQERTPKPAVEWYKQVVTSNAIIIPDGRSS